MKDFRIITNSSIVLEPLSIKLVSRIYKQDWINTVNTRTDKLKSCKNIIKDYFRYIQFLLSSKCYCWIVNDEQTKRIFGIILFNVHSNFLTLDFVFKKKAVSSGVAYDAISRAISAISICNTLPICSYVNCDNQRAISLLIDLGFDFAYNMDVVNYYVKRGK